MKLNSLRINELSAEASAWYLDEYLAAMDALDINRYAQYLANDVSVSFNNDPPVEGKGAAVEMLGGYWKSFAGIEHEPLNIYGSDYNFVLEALNHYKRHDGRRVTTHAVAFTDRDSDGKVSSVRVFADTTPLFAD